MMAKNFVPLAAVLFCLAVPAQAADKPQLLTPADIQTTFATGTPFSATSKGGKVIMITLQLGDVSHIIQLSIAPVFLLTGVGTNLTVLTNRLARIIDRSRTLEDLLQTELEDSAQLRLDLKLIELDELYQRSHLINRAITLSSACALLVCLVIASLFLADATGLEIGRAHV